jgi:prolyl oligopeptidase
MRLFLIVTLSWAFSVSASTLEYGPNHYPWSEDVVSTAVDNFVLLKNAETEKALEAVPEFVDIKNFIQKAIVASQVDRATEARINGAYAYNYLMNDTNPKGLYRRVKAVDYKAAKEAGTLDKLQWEATVNVDEFLNTKKFPKEVTQPSSGSWECFYDKKSKDLKRCLVGVSQSGGDRNIFYEYDFVENDWVKTNSFQFEILGRSGMQWVDEDTLIVSLDGMSYHNHNNPTAPIDTDKAIAIGLLTKSGYPNQTFLWKRGTPFSSAKMIYQGTPDISGLSVSSIELPGYPIGKIYFIYEGIDRTNFRTYFYHDLDSDGVYKKIAIDIPENVGIVGLTDDFQLILQIETPWKSFQHQDLVVVPFEITKTDILQKQANLIFRNTDSDLLLKSAYLYTGDESTTDDDRIVVSASRNVSGEAFLLARAQNTWSKINLKDPKKLKHKSMSISIDDDTKEMFLYVENFTTPRHKYLLTTKNNRIMYKLIDKDKEKFDAQNLKVEQLWVDRGIDQNGKKIRVPYFIVYDSTKVKLENNVIPAPTLMWAYGGFGVGYGANYLGSVIGSLWLNKGGVYVLANIRGGDEFGQYWHTSALKEHRDNTYGDFFAVSEDLIRRGITSPAKLGIQGGSNGGLLMGVAYTQRPELYNAIVCEVPLLDMSRYHLLHVGASWMDEYGNPENETKAFWEQYSPLHQLKTGVKYPPIFIKTNRNDDRVHPAHARKFSARLDDLQIAHYYYEDLSGGHGGDSQTSEESARRYAYTYSYLYQQLGVKY